MNEKQYEYKEPKENLHWISYNMKKVLETQREAVQVLKDIKEQLQKSQSNPIVGKPFKKDEQIPF